MGATAVLNIGSAAGGNIKFVSGQTLTITNGATINLVATNAGSNTFTAGTQAMPNITINAGTGTTYAAQDNMTSATKCILTITQGTFNLNNQTWAVAQVVSSNTNTRGITMGTGTFTMSSTNGGAQWNLATSTNMTFSGASGTITITATSGFGFLGGGLTYGTVNWQAFAAWSSTAPYWITGANTFGTLAIVMQSGAVSGWLYINGNQTVSGTLTMSGLSLTSRLTIQNGSLTGTTTTLYNPGTQTTLTAATVTCTYLNLADIKGAGAGSWNLSAITGNSGDCGNNSSITFTTPANQYWVPSGGTSTGSMSAVTRWATSSGGTAGTGRSPLPQDTAYFDANSIDAGSRTITQDKASLGAVIWTGATNTPAWTRTTTYQQYGSVTTISGMTNSGTVTVLLAGRGSTTLTTGTQSYTNPHTVDCGTGTVTQGDNFAMSGNQFTMNSGTWSGASTYTMSIVGFTFNGGTFSPSATTTMSGGFLMAGGTLTQTQTFTGGTTFQITGGTYTMNQANTFSSTMNFRSGTLAGAYTLTGTTITFGVNTNGALTTTAATISGTTITLNGTSSTFNVGTVTGTGAMTVTAGTWNIADGKSITYNNGAISAAASSGGGGGSFTFS